MPQLITFCPGLRKVVMSRAWVLARQGQRIYGGHVRQFLAEAMRICWTEVKADPVTRAAAEIIKESRARRAGLTPAPVAPTAYLARFAQRRASARIWGSAYL